MIPGSENARNPLATLVHLSDLHFGETFYSQQSWYKQVTRRLPHDTAIAAALSRALRGSEVNPNIKGILNDRFERRIPTVVLHTGDLTCSGLASEFATGQKFLIDSHPATPEPAGLRLKDFRIAPAEGEPLWSPRLFDIPGNHDLFGCPLQLELFNKTYPGPFPIEYEVPGTGLRVVVYGMNSNQGEMPGARNGWGARLKGRVERAQLDELCRLLREGSAAGKIQVVSLHHPLEVDPGNGFDDDWVCLEDRDAVRDELLATGAHLVLAGHIHRYARLGSRNQHIVAGTATQRKSKAANNFLVFDIYQNRISLTRYDWNFQRQKFESHPTEDAAVLPI